MDFKEGLFYFKKLYKKNSRIRFENSQWIKSFMNFIIKNIPWYIIKRRK